MSEGPHPMLEPVLYYQPGYPLFGSFGSTSATDGDLLCLLVNGVQRVRVSDDPAEWTWIEKCSMSFLSLTKENQKVVMMACTT
jgi:hypothetical protein